MSSETRTMLVVLLVCGFLMCGCIVLPLGIGVGFFYVAAERTQAEAAIARERAAVAQAQAQAALNAMQESLPTPPTEPPAGSSAPPNAPVSPPTTAESAQASPPAITLPPLSGLAGSDLPAALPPEAVAAMLADVEQRKALYRAFKQLRDTEEQIKKLGEADPTATALVAALKQQALEGLKASGITQEQIDKILSEGDKEGW